MRITHDPTGLLALPPRERIARERRSRYLAAWPAHAQLEAHAEAAAGRPEKLTQMQADLDAIRLHLPYPETDDAI